MARKYPIGTAHTVLVEAVNHMKQGRPERALVTFEFLENVLGAQDFEKVLQAMAAIHANRKARASAPCLPLHDPTAPRASNEELRKALLEELAAIGNPTPLDRFFP